MELQVFIIIIRRNARFPYKLMIEWQSCLRMFGIQQYLPSQSELDNFEWNAKHAVWTGECNSDAGQSFVFSEQSGRMEENTVNGYKSSQ